VVQSRIFLQKKHYLIKINKKLTKNCYYSIEGNKTRNKMNKILLSFFALSFFGSAFANENYCGTAQVAETPCGCAKIVREENPCCKPEPVMHKVEVELKSCCE
jgi:hypothetical protein